MSQRDLSPIVTLSQVETDPEESLLPRSFDLDRDRGDEVQDALDAFSAVDTAELPIVLDSATPPPEWNKTVTPTDLDVDLDVGVDVDVDVDVNGYADRLMDDIFMEVEHTLDSGVAPVEVEAAEVLNIRSLEMPPLALPAALVPRVDAYTPGSTALALSTSSGSDPSSPLIDRLLLGSVLVSCAVTLGWWILDRDRYDVLLSSPAAIPSEPSPSVAEPDSANEQFAAYLQNALQTLDKTTAQTGTAQTGTATNPAASAETVASLPSVPIAPTTGGLPTVAIPGTPSLGDLSPLPASATQKTSQTSPNTNQGTVLERVYIPVYPNTPGLAAPPSAVAGSLPGVLNPAPPLVASGKLPTVPAGAPAASVATAAAPANPTAVKPDPATGVAPLPEPASVTHSLVGILELGDQSAALFQINGVTRRVHLGEAIGSAGWMLVEVSNQEAVIRRNGEVRSVYIGQNF